MAIAREQRETRALKNEGPTHWSGLRVTREERQIRGSGSPDRPIRRPAEIELSSPSVRNAGRVSTALAGRIGRRRTVRETQRLRQPAGTVEQPLGFLRHLALLEVVQELGGMVALGLPHRFENAGLGDAAEVVVDASAASPPLPCRGRPRGRAGPPGQGAAGRHAPKRPGRHSGRPSRRGHSRRTRRNAREAQRAWCRRAP